MSSFVICEATGKHAEGITNVKYRGWQDTYRGIISNEYLDAMNIEELTLTWQKILSPENKVGKTDVLVNAVDEIIGFVSYARNRDALLDTEGVVMTLYLLKEYHGKGLGAQLFKHGIEQLKHIGVSSFHLNVLTQNPAVKFYRKFKPASEKVAKIKIGDREYDELTLIWKD
jgi:ribosomal protein S18 acetylase RimI-like enzyme